MLNWKLLFIALFISNLCIGQNLPKTNVYLFTFIKDSERLKIKEGKLLTGFNKEGYNNQPCFVDDNSILISSDYYDGNNEIIKLDFYENIVYRITKTLEKEYSPTLSSDQDYFTVVRVGKNGIDQNVHRYPMDLSDKGKTLFPDIKNVGYHCVDHFGNMYAFLVDEPHKLSFIDKDTKKSKVLFDNIGRTLKTDKYNSLLFVHKVNGKSIIKNFNPNTQKATVVHPALANGEDFEYLSSNEMVMSDNGKLYKLNISNNIGWREYVDLSEYGLKNITRIVIRKNKLLVVEQDI